jgi:hypothetical protein
MFDKFRSGKKGKEEKEIQKEPECIIEEKIYGQLA